MNHKTVSRMGGKSTLALYGPDHFSEMGKRSAVIRKQNDPEYFRRISALGVASRRAKAEKKVRA
jgi:hypothetical protein